MSSDEFIPLIESLINGDISDEEHERLQQLLRQNVEARTKFRERVDLEACLRTWAAEDPAPAVRALPDLDASLVPSRNERKSRPIRLHVMLAAIAAGIALLLMTPWLFPERSKFGPLADQNHSDRADRNPATPAISGRLIGSVRQQQDCHWDGNLSFAAGRFSTGSMSLVSGVAELSFDSGTDVVLEAPCELVVTGPNTARLLTGNVFVNVTELSNGFLLSTPEAEIIDLGTEYAVALDESTTEVHVFDGSVIWKPDVEGVSIEDVIETGDARMYSRSDPATPERIPFGRRQFVRRLENEVQQQAGNALLAYDGFENLAGQLRRGRSGFGWSNGWQSGRRGRGRLAEVIDAPDDEAFGLSRSGRRLLRLSSGDNILRPLERPLTMTPGTEYFISLLVERIPAEATDGLSLKVSLEPESTGRRYRQTVTSFGITTEGFPYINTGSEIRKTATRISDEENCLIVVQFGVSERGVTSNLRLYHPREELDQHVPDTWTVSTGPQPMSPAVAIRLSAGNNAIWHIDELRAGTSWRSVTAGVQMPPEFD